MSHFGRATCTVHSMSAPDQPRSKRIYHYTRELLRAYCPNIYIYTVTPGFIANLEDSTDTFGPLEKVFVHEWSKLRYGVFEEFGYPGDEQYPLFYYERSYTDDGIVNDLKPNFCTDYSLEGTRRYDIFF